MFYLEIAMLNGYSGIRTRPGRAEQDFWTLAAYECPDPQLDSTLLLRDKHASTSQNNTYFSTPSSLKTH